MTHPRVTNLTNRYCYIGNMDLTNVSVNNERFLAIYGSKYSDPKRKTAAERYGVSVGFKNYAGSYQAWVHQDDFFNTNRDKMKPEEYKEDMGPIGWKERMLTPQAERYLSQEN